MEYQECRGQWPCPKSSSGYSITEKANSVAHKAAAAKPWKPLSYEESPCNCGCTYIVSGQRMVKITSGPHCNTLPITWKVKVWWLPLGIYIMHTGFSLFTNLTIHEEFSPRLREDLRRFFKLPIFSPNFSSVRYLRK